jgi:transcriptional regulator with XRE-family HTH domain
LSEVPAALSYGMTKRPVKRVVPRFKTRVRRPTFFRQWRKKRNLTLEEAAEKAGMTPGNLSAMERGAQGYTQDGLEALAEAYGVPPGWLTDADPDKLDNLLPIWESAKPSERQKIVEVARTITGKTGTFN